MLYPDLPQPILFHPLKHHLGYIREFIKRQTDTEDSFLQTQIRTLGSSQLDLYLGPLSAQQIARETTLYLQAHHLLEPNAYRLYLTPTEGAYRLIALSDESKWVLRWGIIAGRHVHLHPARYSQQTLRIKANTLKTAVAVSIAIRRYRQSLNLKLVNDLRTQWLKLPPIPTFPPDGTLAKLVRLLEGP